ncbi:MAG TPA: phosphatidate cytidylyltransferase [Candidatus Saccharimonadales bacterium]|nr:phosphatidate cytidylyltransferase [Candidatus Saccharimonadales bacterium]
MTGKRVATAVVLIPLVVGLVLWGSTGVVTLGLAAITLLSLFEYFGLGEAIGHRAYRFWTATCALLILYLQWLTTVVRWGEFGGIVYPQKLSWLLAHFFPRAEDGFFVFVLGMTAIILFTKRPLVETLPAAGISASGLLLVAFPLSYAVRLHGQGTPGPRLLLFALMITWAADTVAYFVGRAIGRHPFAPNLSPKKTWEGAAGSFIGSLLVGVAFTRFLPVSLPHLLAMAAVGNVAGQAGDLVESAYKRSAGIKDSGRLLPGHGGVLDRIDALILAIPVVWYYWILVCAPRS